MRTRSRSRLLAPLAVCVLLVLGGGVWAAAALTGRSGCPASPVLVTASPDVAPAISQVAQGISPGCRKYEVQPRDTAQAAVEFSAPGGGARPQVWVPDSTTALQGTRQRGATDVPESGPSVAGSPVVLAVTEGVARNLGWPGRTLTWPDVLDAPGVVLGLPDPARDPVGTAALLGLRDTVGSVPDPSGAFAAALRKFSVDAPGATAYPAAESFVVRHNADSPAAPLVAVYSPAAPALDYPFARLSGATSEQNDAVDALQQAVLGSAGTAAVERAGLRAPGQALTGHEGDPHVVAAVQPDAPLPSAATLKAVLSQWAGVNLNARAEVLLDVSGSMQARVPGTRLSRMQVTVGAAEQAMHLFRPATQLRVWEFATQLDGAKDYREVLPMAPVSEHLTNGDLERLSAVRAIPNAGTGLYDTLLDVYGLARSGWQPGVLNVVIVMTDGHNEDMQSVGRDALLSGLARLADPAHPIPVIAIGIGTDADEAELSAITAVTGGAAYVTRDPTKIGEVFYAALAKIATS
ncbi:substrate-binding domain-containing protein [Amycolatopsis sp. FDAARGOS 1241]|uniref:substrate-binding domain-containing protein n=1 Tax=Amycolatopsis sp. FDAARGOS 1241 TaxID=2778070 RepID=UPI001EF3D02F|nr:substrate-binding domain-containing protein [Amycolatopsis sp. FDAARGOS 1241]